MTPGVTQSSEVQRSFGNSQATPPSSLAPTPCRPGGHRRADWWTIFLLAHRNTNRITEPAVTLCGAVGHVACDSRDHATWLAATMLEHGLPRCAVKSRTRRGQGGGPLPVPVR
jgi:hypothetical protein